jgi:hypothetical protein
MATGLGLVVLGAAIALLGAGRPSGAAPGSVPVGSGADSSPAAATALALVALAGAGATLLVRNWARTVLGGVLVVVAVALVSAGLSPTRWAALIGGVLVGLGALAVVARARRWPQPRRRFEAPARRPTGTPRDTWDALDRGEDPTA